MNTLDDFPKGRRVRYVGPQNGKALHPYRVGQFAKVIRTVKSRKCVTIEWEGDGTWYDAFPASLVVADVQP